MKKHSKKLLSKAEKNKLKKKLEATDNLGAIQDYAKKFLFMGKDDK